MADITVQNLTKYYGDRLILDGISFDLQPGEKVALLGGNGAGKTTLFNILTRRIPFDSGVAAIGEGRTVGIIDQIPIVRKGASVDSVLRLAFREVDALRRRQSALAEKMAAGDTSEATLAAYGTVSERLEWLGGYNYDYEIDKVCAGLAIPREQRSQEFALLSGGEKTRVNLARIILEHTDILLLDEPTNDLDLETVAWLEDYLSKFENTVLIVSHDRHFLDSVSTHTLDIDYSKVSLFAGNYSFWYQSSQLALRQQQQANKKAEEKRKELMEFIQRFSANVSKSKQTTSRKKMLEKLNVEEIQPSSRRYPGIIFTPNREPGNKILEVKGLTASIDGEVLFKDVNFQIEKGDKVAFLSRDPRAMTAFFEIINGRRKPDAGTYEWGQTITTAYLPLDNSEFFNTDYNLVDWLGQYSDDSSEIYLKGFLGKMLFSGEDVLKKASVLSGGEKIRCMIARMMLRDANTMILDSPTNHLDLESIQAFNNTLQTFKGNILMASHDHEFIQTVCNRIIELTPGGIIDKLAEYDDYITDPRVLETREKLYAK